MSWSEPAATLPRPRPTESDEDLFLEEPGGPLVMPGAYQVALAKRVEGVVTPLAAPQTFTVVVEGDTGSSPADRNTLQHCQLQ